MTATFRTAMMIAGVAAAAAGASPAGAKDTVAVGQLTCSIKGGSSFILGSTRELLCTFRVRPEDQGELYEGVIKKFGLDVGKANNTIFGMDGAGACGCARLSGRSDGQVRRRRC